MFSFPKLPIIQKGVTVWKETNKYLKRYKSSNVLKNLERYEPSNVIKNLNNTRRSKSSESPTRTVPWESEKNFMDLRGIVSDEQYAEFMGYFPDIVEDLSRLEKPEHIPSFTDDMKEAMEYNVPYEFIQPSLTAVVCYKNLEKPENLTEENRKLGNILGWCIQLFYGYFKIIDDISDGATMRGAKPSWYTIKKPTVALSHACLLLISPNILLKKYFSSHRNYIPIVETFNAGYYQALVGQHIDVATDTVEAFSSERFELILKYEPDQCCEWPLQMAMYLANIYDKHFFDQLRPLLKEMGKYIIIENDFFDSFGTLPLKGTNSEDIAHGKCTWVSTTAYRKANKTQRKLLEMNYGRSEERSIKTVISLYEELDIPAAFYEHKETSFNTLYTQIKQLPNEPIRKAMFSALEISYRRKCDQH